MTPTTIIAGTLFAGIALLILIGLYLEWLDSLSDHSTWTLRHVQKYARDEVGFALVEVFSRPVVKEGV